LGILASKQLDRTWLSANVTRAPKVVESCSKAQKMRQVLQSALKKIFLLEGCKFFVSDVTSGGHLGHLAHFTWP